MRRNKPAIRRKRWLLLCAVLLAVLPVFMNTPDRRIGRFVSRYGDRLEEAIVTDGGIPANIGIRFFNEWDGSHPMTELILWTRGNTYYGCYYSSDLVPLAFQNTGVPLQQQADGTWLWWGEGDNRGSTWQIEGKWFGFCASF